MTTDFVIPRPDVLPGLGGILAQPEQPARLIDQLVARQARAAGATRRPITAIRMEGALIVNNRVINPYVIWLKQPGQIRIEATIDGLRYAQAFDGRTAWQWMTGQGRAARLPAAETLRLRRQAEWPSPVCPLRDFRERGHSLELLGQADREGGVQHVLRLRLKDGLVRDYWMDARGCAIRRARELRPGQGGEPPQVIEIFWEEFRRVGGVRLPFGEWEREAASGAVLRNLTWRKLDLNPALPADLFSRP